MSNISLGAIFSDIFSLLIARIVVVLCLLVMVVSPVQSTTPQQQKSLRILASNTAMNSGLILSLSKAFEKANPSVKIEIKAGGGLAILNQARYGKTDLVITHHPASEKLFMSEGYGLSRTLVMYNQFAIYGPPDDPLGLIGQQDLVKVLQKMADEQVPFMVPDTLSGTQKKLSELWDMIGVEPDWPGYEITGAGSASSLRNAAMFDTYAFADIGTYLANREHLGGNLVPIFRDHSALRNYYSAIIVNGERFKGINQALAEAFLEFLISDQGQLMIRNYGENNYGTAVFTPAAHLDEGLKSRRTKAELAEKNRILRLLTVLTVVLTVLTTVAIWLFVHSRRLGRQTRLSEERFSLAVEGSSDGVWDWDISSDKAYFSPRLNQIIGLPEEETSTRNPSHALEKVMFPSDYGELRDKLQEYLESGYENIFSSEFRVVKEKDEEIWAMIRGKALRDPDGYAIRMSGSITDITENKRQAAAIEYQALHDALTGLPNRILLQDRLEQAIKGNRRDERGFSLLMMDLNRFKGINDTLGHHIGDEVLKEVAIRLQRILRKSDTVARLGGDEFAILLPGSDSTHAYHVAQKILLALKKVMAIDGRNLYVGGSIGISVFPHHGRNSAELIQHADVAMYISKRNNTNVAVYDYEEDSNSIRSLTLEKDLQDAISENALLLYYQPKIDIACKIITGVEALLRWDHPEMGMIPPAEIIGIAEQSGLIKPLSNWIINKALAQQAEWLRDGIELKMAVNLSMRNLQDPMLLKQIERTISINKSVPNNLELEITESAMMDDSAQTIQSLEKLSRMGIKLTVDDYGTGFSSLAYLKKLPVDTLKIDKSFVINMARDKSDASIVRSTIDLAHNLGLKVVAEGVKDKVSLDILVSQGCDTAQGYYFSRPVPSIALIKWLNESPWGVGIKTQQEDMKFVKSTKVLH